MEKKEIKLIIDADACPVVDIAVEISKEYGIGCLIVCDTAHEIKRDGAKTFVAPKGADSVDFHIVSIVKSGDIVVTQDYGLASIILSKEANAINQDGLIYNRFNIESLLFSRHISQKLRNSGKRTKGPKKRVLEQDESFRKNLIKLLSSL